MKVRRDVVKDRYGSSLLFQPVIRGKKSTALFVCERYLTQDPNRETSKSRPTSEEASVFAAVDRSRVHCCRDW